MKKLTFFLLFCCISSFAFSQQLFFEAFSGYNRTAYNLTEYAHTGHVPLGFRIAGGLERVQLGIEYRRNITNPEFDLNDATTSEPNYRETYDQDYYGGLVRVNISSLPAYRFGLILKGGAGFYNTTRNTYDLKESTTSPTGTFKFEKQLGFNGGIGISAPIFTLLHWEIGYQYNYVKYDDQPNIPVKDFNGSYHSFQMGLSLNLVFGNTAKKCRRVISSRR